MPEMKAQSAVTDDESPVEILDGSEALAVLNRSEIDVQISTAKRYPRSISVFRKQAEEMATLDEETAGSMFYALPRAGKTIEGPSVRLAEVVGSAWGNIRYAARTVSIDQQYVTAQGVAYDLEKNVFSMIEVKRRITDRMHRRYDEDMIGVTANAAQSIAVRNAIFKVVPFAYVKSIYEKAKQVSIGKAMTMEQRRTRALEWYAKIGASEVILLKLLNRKDVTDITIEDLVVLQGLKTAIHDGETTIEQALKDAGVVVGKLDTLTEALKKNGKEPAATTASAANPANTSAPANPEPSGGASAPAAPKGGEVQSTEHQSVKSAEAESTKTSTSARPTASDAPMKGVDKGEEPQPHTPGASRVVLPPSSTAAPGLSPEQVTLIRDCKALLDTLKVNPGQRQWLIVMKLGAGVGEQMVAPRDKLIAFKEALQGLVDRKAKK